VQALDKIYLVPAFVNHDWSHFSSCAAWKRGAVSRY